MPSSPSQFPSPSHSPLSPPSRPTHKLLEAETFDLHCFQSLTGTKFLLAVEPKSSGVDVLMQRIYEMYGDYVMKNPFYEVRGCAAAAAGVHRAAQFRCNSPLYLFIFHSQYSNPSLLPPLLSPTDRLPHPLREIRRGNIGAGRVADISDLRPTQG
jgi:hypothetical protein